MQFDWDDALVDSRIPLSPSPCGQRHPTYIPGTQPSPHKIPHLTAIPMSAQIEKSHMRKSFVFSKSSAIHGREGKLAFECDWFLVCRRRAAGLKAEALRKGEASRRKKDNKGNKRPQGTTGKSGKPEKRKAITLKSY